MDIQECIKNIEKYKQNPENPTNNGWNFGRNGKTAEEIDEVELQRFVDTMNKVVKILKKEQQRKHIE